MSRSWVARNGASRGPGAGGRAKGAQDRWAGKRRAHRRLRLCARTHTHTLAQDRNYATVAKAVAAVKDADIGAVLDVLDVDSCDVLMKYIYKGMEKLDNSPMWLKWHGPTLGKTGRSGIVRVFTDRKRV